MKGLLLVGGKSSRMGTDKAALILRDGISQRERGLELLGKVCDQVFLSTSSDSGEPNTIPDTFGPIGPLGAIASAQKADPDTAWLVLACDLPLLEEEHLKSLISNRDQNQNATYFISASDGLPEPLCAIWEASSAAAVRSAIENGQACPRSVLKSLRGHALPSPGLWALANTNTEADLIEVRTRINRSTHNKTVTVSYFAQLREITGKDRELFETDSETPAGLFEEIRATYKIPLKRKGMMVAVNGDFTDWTHSLAGGEEIVFLPPVAGG